MDTQRGFDEDRDDADQLTGGASDAGVDEPTPAAIGTDERRMHVRAYNHWVSLLRGRAYPSIEDLDPANIADFGPHSVLLDFTKGVEDPKIAYLGAALREETGHDKSITHISQVPSRSLLSRLTDHYLQIIANRAPIGFEAEFVGIRGHNTMYRGILMPFSSNDDTIDFIYGVINWKELVDAETQATLDAEVDAALRAAPKPRRGRPGLGRRSGGRGARGRTPTIWPASSTRRARPRWPRPPPTRAAAPRCIARWAARTISGSPPSRTPTPIANCSRMPASPCRSARR